MNTDNVKLAIGAILLSVFALSFGDAIIKLVSIQFSLWQVYVLRSVFAIPMVLGIIALSRRSISLIPVSLPWTIVRSALLAVMWVVYYTSLPYIKLSVAAAVYYTIPLFITLYSAAFTGDRVTPRAWFAVALGFGGVLIIVRPATDGFNAYVLLPLVAANLYALAMILTRTRCRAENPKVLSLWLNLTFLVFGLVVSAALSLASLPGSIVDTYPFLAGPWIRLGSTQWLVMALLACIIVIGSLFAAVAYQNGPSSLVATFDYAYLGFSVMWGLLVFAEVPDGLTILGIVMVAVAGIIAVRE